MKKPSEVDYRMPTREDRLNRRKVTRVEALRQFSKVTPLSAAAQCELDQHNSAKVSKTKKAKTS